MANDETIRPFTLEFAETELTDLGNRLERVRWPELPDSGWQRGVPVSYLRDLVSYWVTDYDWRAAESELNDLPQYVTDIDGTTIHFLHITSPEKNALPFLLTHGWPGSIVEFLDIIGPLTDPATHGGESADAFHLVIPSIPGFGLSGPTPDSGWTESRVAAAFATLMDRLGYDRYGAQGGDVGASISPHLGRVAPEHVVGVHVNAATVGFMPFAPLPADEVADLDEADQGRVQQIEEFMADEFGYAQIQSTRPDTLAYGLTD